MPDSLFRDRALHFNVRAARRFSGHPAKASSQTRATPFAGTDLATVWLAVADLPDEQPPGSHPLSRSLLRSTGLVSSLTFLSRILGFVRDLAIAGIFGASAETDAFFVAFKIPNLLRRLFSEGAFSQAFVPVLASVRETEGTASARDFISRVAGSFSLVLGIVSALGMVAAPWLLRLFAPGFMDHPGQYALGVSLLQITFPYLLFISLTALAGGILNTWNHFAVPAFTPVLLNLSMIWAAFWLAPHMAVPIESLAWGVLAAGILQLSFQFPALYRLGLLPLPRIDFANPQVRRVMQLMAPAIFGASVNQINLLVNTFIASLMMTGSISWLYYSDRLVEFPLGILGVGLGTVMLPHLSKSQARRDSQQFSSSVDWALRWLILLGVPATLGLIVLAEPLMFTLFQHDQFTANDARMAARSLGAYGIGLMGFLAVKILVPGFSAREDLATPARFGVYAVILNLLLSIVLALLMAPAGWGHAGLALAASLASILNAGLLLNRLMGLRVYTPEPHAGRFMLRVASASIVMGIAIGTLGNRFAWEVATSSQRLLDLSLCIGAGMLAYLITLILTGMRPGHLLMQTPA